jgi:hypothetical protein
MNRYRARVLDSMGDELDHFHVHAHTQDEAQQQAQVAFYVLFRDKALKDYEIEVTFDRAIEGKRL